MADVGFISASDMHAPTRALASARTGMSALGVSKENTVNGMSTVNDMLPFSSPPRPGKRRRADSSASSLSDGRSSGSGKKHCSSRGESIERTVSYQINPMATEKVEINGTYGATGHVETARNADIVTEVPKLLLFGTKVSEDEFNISEGSLQKLPAACLAKILRGSHVGTVGTATICRLGATSSVESLQRLGEFLKSGDYKPFKPHVPLEVIDSEGALFDWSVLPTKPDNVRPTEATLTLYKNEMRLYLFALDIGYEELRQFSSMKLRTCYPVYGAETLALLEHLYHIAHGTDSLPKDEELVDFMKSSVHRNRDELVKHPRFLEILRESVGFKNPLGQLLLDTHIESTEQLRTELVLSNTFVKPEYRPQPLSLESPEASKGVSLLVDFHEALMFGRLGVAAADGYGTLLSSSGNITRNKDFRFVEGELLWVDPSLQAFNGRHNVIVENSRGQKGDVLRHFVWTVPSTLGRNTTVNVGKLVQEREMRTFGPRPDYHDHKGRSRSRSPPRFSYYE